MDVHPAGSRWHRLWPAGPADLVLLAVAALGLVVYVFALLTGGAGAGGGALAMLFSLVIGLNATMPTLLLGAVALYLTRRGRTIGPDRRWVWAGFVVTLPFVLLVGQPLSIRGAGDITALVIPIVLLVALGLMAVGAYRTLRDR